MLDCKFHKNRIFQRLVFISQKADILRKQIFQIYIKLIFKGVLWRIFHVMRNQNPWYPESISTQQQSMKGPLSFLLLRSPMKNLNVVLKSENLSHYKVKGKFKKKSCIDNYCKLRIYTISKRILDLPRIMKQSFKEGIAFSVHFECWPLG